MRVLLLFCKGKGENRCIKPFESWRSICVNYNVDSDISETLQDVGEDEFEVEEKELDIDGSELTNVIFEEEALKEL